RVDAVLDDRFEGRALEDRLSDDTVGPCYDFAAAHGAAQAMQEKWPVVSTANIVFARPHQLDRTSGPNRLGGLSKLGREMHIRLPASAEASAGQHGVDLDAFERQAQDGSDHIVIAGLQLAPEAGPCPFPIPAQKSVERLHR